MKFNRLVIILLIFTVFAGCSSKKEKEVTEQKPEEWPEMESFHSLMAEAYHPYKDSANLEPAKRLAEGLAKESEKWASETPPSQVNNEEMKSKLEKLKTDSRTLADQVKSGAVDEQIGTSLTVLHGQFHEIMEAWHHSK